MIIMAEVLLKCLVRETKSVYRKLYDVFKLPLIGIAIIAGGFALGFLLAYSFRMIADFINLVGVLIKNNFYEPIRFVVLTAVEIFISIPIWAIVIFASIVIFIGMPVGYAFIKCVVREDKKKVKA